MSIDRCITSINVLAYDHRDKDDLVKWAKDARAEHANLCKKAKFADELLAIIHGDGGHNTDVKSAHDKIVELRADSLMLDKLIEWVLDGWTTLSVRKGEESYCVLTLSAFRRTTDAVLSGGDPHNPCKTPREAIADAMSKEASD